MYKEDIEIKNIAKRRKIVDIIFFSTIILWGIVWAICIWINLIKSSINPFIGAFIGFIILSLTDFVIVKFFIWLNVKVGKIKR